MQVNVRDQDSSLLSKAYLSNKTVSCDLAEMQSFQLGHN